MLSGQVTVLQTLSRLYFALPVTMSGTNPIYQRHQ